MIVRILGEGRFEIPDSEMPVIEKIDSRLVEAIDGSDEVAFSKALSDLIAEVREKGKVVPADDLRASAQVVPHEGSTLSEVKALLAQGS